ncbi:hypothetical protein T4B_763 [Trichinella pseudospiralis]|uniref:Uncharacterized protein n=1 Tax=Trichinella pseudospiralis TaxID=6337 RepID=A0A0V1IQT1_TRIPS|nr:hypothetical protein T4B_763 [Trichinella pseudospiralis]
MVSDEWLNFYVFRKWNYVSEAGCECRSSALANCFLSSGRHLCNACLKRRVHLIDLLGCCISDRVSRIDVGCRDI